MTVTLPPELAPLLHEAGGQWPESDEERLHDLAGSWRGTSGKLQSLRTDGSAIANAIAAENRGASVDAFHAQWTELDRQLELSITATDQLAAAVDSMATAVLSAKSGIVEVLSAGQEQMPRPDHTAAIAIWGPLIRLITRTLGPYLLRIANQLWQLVRNSIKPLFDAIGRFFTRVFTWFGDQFTKFSRSEPKNPVYQRDAPLPPANQLIKNGQEWTGTGRKGGNLPNTAQPNQVLFRTDSETGKIRNYSVYDPNGFAIKRVDLEGAPHGSVPTPHVQYYRTNTDPKTGITRAGEDKKVGTREARSEEIP